MATSAPVYLAPEMDFAPLSVRRNFAWSFSGSAIYSLCQWGILIVIAKIGSTVMLGRFALALAITAPVFMFTNFQLSAVLASDALQEYQFSNYLTLRLAGSTSALLLICGLVLIARFQRETAVVALAIAFAKAAESFSDLIYGLWQKYERFKKVAIALSVRGVGSLAVMLVTLRLTHNIGLSAAVLALWWTVWLVLYEYTGAKKILEVYSPNNFSGPKWDRVQLKKLVSLCWPCGFIVLMLALAVNIPRYFIQHDLGSSQLGYFAAVAYLPAIGTTVISALCQSALPRLSRHFEADRPAYFLLLRKMVVIAFSFGIAGAVIAAIYGSSILKLIYSREYTLYVPLLIWMTIAAAFAYTSSVLGYGMTAMRRFREQVPLLVFVAGVIAVACWATIPRVGVIGAAYSSALGFLVLTLGNAWIIYTSARKQSRIQETA